MRLQYTSSTVFSSSAVFIGYLFIGLGVIGLVTVQYALLGLLIIPIGIFLAFSKYGIILDDILNQYRVYASYFGIKTGDWEDLEKMPDIAILKSRESSTTYSGSIMSNIHEDEFYKVFLLSPSHRKKVLVIKTKQKDNAQKVVDEITGKFDILYTTYNPRPINRPRR